ncbi:MAG: ABC transporter substrate-binding protein [SAR324 cluster bacterium]|nr:ABC transporter substrate-binding protein [SAR324 cluster bacterium]
MKKFLVIFLSMMLFASMTWAKTIKIGVAGPFTGPLASFGLQLQIGATMKAKEINAAGGINGNKVEPVFMDEMCDPKEAATVATRMANDKSISIVIGHLCSSSTLAALPIYKTAKLPAISPTSTNVSIGKMSPFYFRNVYRDDFQGLFLAQYVKKVKKFKKVAIFYEVNDYSMGLMQAFVKEALKLKIRIIGTEAFTNETTDFKPQLTNFKMMRPDAIFVPGYHPQALLIASQAASLGIKTVIFGADGLDNAAMENNPDTEGLFVTTPFLVDKAGPAAAGFIKAHKKARNNEDPGWMTANTFDAFGMAVDAIKAVGENRVKIREYLAGINSAGNGYKGVTGLTYFDANGDCLKAAYVKEIKNGKWVSSKQLD